MPHTIQTLLTRDKAALEAALGLEAGGARIEAQMLLQAALQVSRAYLLSHPEQSLDSEQQARYAALLERRLRGEPLAYLIGEREFFGLMFKVTPATLIPRPDTELLVELALQRLPSPLPLSRLREREERSGGRGYGFRVLDLGTGSGAIALSIAHARPDVVVTAVDASPEALEVARGNARRLNIANARLLRSDWFSALSGERFDLIVSNPPYVADGDAHLVQGDLRFEPRSALASGADGLDDIRRIVAQAKDHLNAGGWLLFEHGYDQAARVRDLLGAAGFGEAFSARDLAGLERVSGGKLPEG
ncbi:MAG: peptide chain release factor N(5)-glutamine methyltransferase [Nitrosomonadales bacterium]|nr:peptide chain release factor N(5)-glutamine methyltransferase [Nitrosomonadales bacterium]